jgi:hypothetical protein
MKITFRLIFSIGIFYIVCGIACKKSTPSPTLPPITEEGKNTFGCKVNGQVWVPYLRCSDFAAGEAELGYIINPINTYSSLPISIWLQAGNYANGQTVFNFQQNYSLSDHIYGPGNIIDSLIINFSTGGWPIYSNFQIYPTQNTARFLQISKLDTINKIVSGIFAFTLYSRTGVANTLDSVVITDGRFDLQIGSYSRCSP